MPGSDTVLVRTLIANMVEGVSNGYQKKLEIQGVGYRSFSPRPEAGDGTRLQPSRRI